MSAVPFFGWPGLRQDAFRQTRDNHPARHEALHADKRRKGTAPDPRISRSALTTQAESRNKDLRFRSDVITGSQTVTRDRLSTTMISKTRNGTELRSALIKATCPAK